MPTLMPDISAGSLGAYLVAGIATLDMSQDWDSQVDHDPRLPVHRATECTAGWRGWAPMKHAPDDVPMV